MRSLMIIALSLVACTTAPPADGSAVQAIVTPLFPTPPLVTVGPAAAIAASTTASYNGWGWNVGVLGAAVRYPVALPRGAKLTGWQLYLQRGIEAAPTSARLQCQDATGTHSDVGPVVQRIDSATGATSLDATFSATVDPACVSYSVLVTGCSACADTATGLAVYGSQARDRWSALQRGTTEQSLVFEGGDMFRTSANDALFSMPILGLTVGEHLTAIHGRIRGTGGAQHVRLFAMRGRPDGSSEVAATVDAANPPDAWATYDAGCSSVPVTAGDDFYWVANIPLSGTRVGAVGYTVE